jgi:hypothetical protein
MGDIFALIDAREQLPTKRGPYRKRLVHPKTENKAD